MDTRQGGSPADDTSAVLAVLGGDVARFEEIVLRYQPRMFAMARRYARREDEVQDIVQEIFIKSFQRLNTWRQDAPFEHWLMRIGVRVCYDFLRGHQRNKESVLSDLTEDESRWLERAEAPGGGDSDGIDGDAAKSIVGRLLEQMSPSNRLIINLLEIEDKSVKEVAALTGWSVPLVKVRAFRARAEMKKLLQKLSLDKFL
ncbi:MAG TPA: RNA polymerase sigma factor [Candidatus Limnocylindria bacterium]|nr:RNA polymerase sigma factor [Candidatus Limnocylindria bacterium]